MMNCGLTKIISTKDNKQVQFRRLNNNDLDNLYDYLRNLSSETKSRFGPHPFDNASLINFYQRDTNRGYIALNVESKEIIGYSILKIGYLEHDRNRLEGYGLTLDSDTDCTFAPSVADSWQSCGIGSLMFQFILSDLKFTKIARIILWGGVKMDNERAVKFYKKYGFQTLGQFTYNGENYDMIYFIRQTSLI